jgi:hypothetical protein
VKAGAVGEVVGTRESREEEDEDWVEEAGTARDPCETVFDPVDCIPVSI